MRIALFPALGMALLAAPAFSAQNNSDQAQRYDICLSKAHSAPSEAYEDALIWRAEDGSAPARHCLAVALLALGALADGADKLESLANAPDLERPQLRPSLLAQSGEAWMQAGHPQDAVRVYSEAIKSYPDDADNLIGRAIALQKLEKPDLARRDLDAALLRRPDDPLALRLRAQLRLDAGDLAGAQQDINRALAKTPNSVETLLVRGRIREARRLQHP